MKLRLVINFLILFTFVSWRVCVAHIDYSKERARRVIICNPVSKQYIHEKRKVFSSARLVEKRGVLKVSSLPSSRQPVYSCYKKSNNETAFKHQFFPYFGNYIDPPKL